MDILGQTSFGWLALLPAFVAIALAFKTKNVYISLFLGVYSGIVVFDIFNWVVVGDNSPLFILVALFAAIIQIPIYLSNSIGDPSNGGIVLQVLFIGGMIQLVSYSGGARHLAEAIAKRAKTSKQTQLLTWVMGLVVFFDDYANALIVGPIMRPISDKMNISREKFAFIIDATAAPIAGLAIISTWIGYELGLIGAGLDSVGIDASSFTVFMGSIPFRFYNILMLIFIVLTIKMGREFGPMLEVERLARDGKKTPGFKTASEVEEGSEEMLEKENIESNIWDGIIPITVLIVGALVFFYISGYTAVMGGDDVQLVNLFKDTPFSFKAVQEAFSNANAAVVLFQAALLAILVMFARATRKKQYGVGEGIEVFMKGANNLLSTVFVLLLAWSLGDVIGQLGASDYMVAQLSDKLPMVIVPAITFALAGFIAFSTGTSFGTMGIMMPIVIPLAFSINPDMSYVTVAIASILTGATFGDHCSPISDTTILSSMGAGCDHIEHVRTQMPYALTVGVISIIGYVLAAASINLAIIYMLTVACLCAVLLFVGKKI